MCKKCSDSGETQDSRDVFQIIRSEFLADPARLRAVDQLEQFLEEYRFHLGASLNLCSYHLPAAMLEPTLIRGFIKQIVPENAVSPHKDDCVYYMLNPTSGEIKIGHSVQVGKRRDTLSREVGCDLEVLATEPGGRTVERIRHFEFREHRVSGEWFLPSPELLVHIETLSSALVS